jgi:hypothetical protein
LCRTDTVRSILSSLFADILDEQKQIIDAGITSDPCPEQSALLSGKHVISLNILVVLFSFQGANQFLSF